MHESYGSILKATFKQPALLDYSFVQFLTRYNYAVRRLWHDVSSDRCGLFVTDALWLNATK